MTPDQRRRRRGTPDNQGTPFVISPLSPSCLNPCTQQMLATRTLFAKDVSSRGGFPSWASDDLAVATVSQPNDADGDGVAEDAGGLLTTVGVGTLDVTASFPGAVDQTTDFESIT